ncbi:iron permease FTR1 [Thelephora ganbajun]|uniref:Iron permease FTR1 n=1 Tax=Thelephora ganbajun TaxID=370292 RepID=A0ACB6Z3C7_THEGA|nr:iron permease FTR1 [Thelephora ganbajun]
MPNVFSVPIFFIVFREALETAIIISVLLGVVEQIANTRLGGDSPPVTESEKEKQNTESGVLEAPPSLPSNDGDDASSDEDKRKKLLRKLRIQIFVGSGVGLLVALAIGAAFVAVWFTKASDLWKKSEQLWEGTFALVASTLIFVVGITMLKMDKAKVKWRVKLQEAFDGKNVDNRTKAGKWALVILPLVTILREGMEGVIFVGGVSLGQPATSIPLPAIVGIICGLTVGYIIYAFASRTTLTIFLAVMTNLILLIGSGLFSKSIGNFQAYKYNKLLGIDVEDAIGNGPGSYDVRGNVWHLDCCNPERRIDGQGWLIFAAIFGWSNNGSLGTILGYVFYWIAVMVTLFVLKRRGALFTLEGTGGS